MTGFGLLYLFFAVFGQDCIHAKISNTFNSLRLFLCSHLVVLSCHNCLSSASSFRREKHNPSGKIILTPIYF